MGSAEGRDTSVCGTSDMITAMMMDSELRRIKGFHGLGFWSIALRNRFVFLAQIMTKITRSNRQGQAMNKPVHHVISVIIHMLGTMPTFQAKHTWGTIFIMEGKQKNTNRSIIHSFSVKNPLD